MSTPPASSPRRVRRSPRRGPTGRHDGAWPPRWTLPAASLVICAIATPAVGALDARGTWRVLPAPPIDLTSAQTAAWTGSEALFAIPSTGTRKAVAYDPTTNSWRLLPPGPAPATPLEGGDRSVWTGREWILVGWGPSSAYRPATNTWRRLPNAPVFTPGPVVAWTGTELIGWGGGCCGDFADDGASYRPATNAWRRLPDAPLSGRQQATGTWTGREMVIVGGFTERTFPDGVTRSITFRDGAAYNPVTRTWRRLPPMPAPRRGASAVWTGRDMLVVAGWKPSGTATAPARGLFAYRPSTNRWRVLAPLPRGRSGVAAVWTGSRLVVWGGSIERAAGTPTETPTALAYDRTRNRWLPLATSPVPGRNDPPAVWTGQEVIVGSGPDPARASVAALAP